MIDWPNALAGFVFGVLTTLMFWIPDRIRATRQRRRDLWEEWKVAMQELELVAFKPETRGIDFHIARSRFPVDHWRAVLPEREGFILLEKLEGSYPSVEHFGNQFAADPSDINAERFRRAERTWNDARIAFINYSRKARSIGYHELVEREKRRETRRDLLRHPFKAIQRMRLNARRRKMAK